MIIIIAKAYIDTYTRINEVFMRRNSIQIMAEILDIAMRGERKTRIMYKANLNHKTLSKYLCILIDNNLLVKMDTPKGEIFKTTRKGSKFLMDYRYLYNNLQQYYSPRSP